MRSRIWKVLALLFAITLIATACGDDDSGGSGDGTSTTAAGEGDTSTTANVDANQGDGSLLDVVKERGTVICGIADEVPGFAALDADGEYQGFDVDFCRVIAAGVLGDPEAVEFKPLTADQRFTALQSGEVDVLVRNTTNTAFRDGSEGVTFLFTTFYDGQAMMVPADSGITDFEGLEGAAICVQSGTTTELNLASTMGALGIAYTPLTFSSNDDVQTAYDSGQCQGWTSDASQLAGFKSKIEEGGGPEQTILPEIISKEPLGPLVADGDTQWAQAVDWATMAPVAAEEFGLTQENIGEYDTEGPDANPDIVRFVGQATVQDDDGNDTGEAFDPGLGLPLDFNVVIVESMGNYAEIYDRHIPGIGIDRAGTPNELWTEGGLLYTPPYR